MGFGGIILIITLKEPKNREGECAWPACFHCHVQLVLMRLRPPVPSADSACSFCGAVNDCFRGPRSELPVWRRLAKRQNRLPLYWQVRPRLRDSTLKSEKRREPQSMAPRAPQGPTAFDLASGLNLGFAEARRSSHQDTRCVMPSCWPSVRAARC